MYKRQLLTILCAQHSYADFFNPSENDSWYTKILQDSISPVTTEARYLLVGGSLTSLGFYLQKHSGHTDYIESEYAEDKPLGSSSKYGDLAGQMIPNAIYTVGMYTFGLFTKDSQAKEKALFMIRATAYPALLSTLLKASIQENRPNGAKYSFPSGHATTIFAFATAVACEHPWYWGVPAFALAGFVGISRMNDNKHYFHDVLAGATLGSSYALGLYLLDKKRVSAQNEEAFYPVQSELLTGLGFYKTW